MKKFIILLMLSALEAFSVNIIDVTSIGSLIENGTKYKAENCFDGLYSTMWAYRMDNGQKPWIKVKIKKEMVSNIGIINGFSQNDDLFAKNARIKRVKINFENEGKLVWSNVFSIEDINDLSTLVFKPVLADSITFVVDNIFPGSKYKDLCITEIKINNPCDSQWVFLIGKNIYDIKNNKRDEKTLARLFKMLDENCKGDQDVFTEYDKNEQYSYVCLNLEIASQRYNRQGVVAGAFMSIADYTSSTNALLAYRCVQNRLQYYGYTDERFASTVKGVLRGVLYAPKDDRQAVCKQAIALANQFITNTTNAGIRNEFNGMVDALNEILQ